MEHTVRSDRAVIAGGNRDLAQQPIELDRPQQHLLGGVTQRGDAAERQAPQPLDQDLPLQDQRVERTAQIVDHRDDARTASPFAARTRHLAG